MDGFSKYFVGYAMADNMKTDLVIQALHAAVIRHNPDQGLIHHSDKGSQYTSYRFQIEVFCTRLSSIVTHSPSTLLHLPPQLPC